MIVPHHGSALGASAVAIERGAPHEVRARSEIKIVFAVGGLYTEGSGVARIVCDLANALLRQGSPVEVYTADCPGHGADGRWLTAPNRLHAPPGRWCGRLAWSPALKRLLNEAVAHADVVHNHSLWMLPTRYAARAAARHGIPTVFTAHGFLEPWALARSRWKKRAVGWMFQNEDLRSARCIHVNSRAEMAGIRAYGLRNPVAVIPNGVQLGEFERMPERDLLARRFPELRGKRVCLFLSRLHMKKGLEHLIVAWTRLHRDFADWHLVIGGPDDGYEARLRAGIAAGDLSRSVTVAGPLYGPEKLAALSAAELFVLPSHSEGFSMAVLEALAAGLPTLLTPGCNFPEAAQRGAAVEVGPNAAETEAALRSLLSSGAAELAAMGRRGREMVERDYTWDRVAEATLQLYRWMAGGGVTPDFVTTT